MSDETLFHEAQAIPAAERSAYLDQACGADAAQRQRIESLLRAHENPGSFMARPLAGLAVTTDQLPNPLVAQFADVAAPVGLIGQMIGRYKLLQLIGEGGFGTVYMAQQEHPVRRRVALKIIKLGMDTKQVIARFEAERQALAMMEHPNIAKVFDAGCTETGRPYFVMELVRGVPITDYCDTNNLTLTDRLELFVEVCRAVQHAHQKGIIHRDIKPGNVMVAMAEGKPIPKVIDFGIAKATNQQLTEKTIFTEFRQMIGTPQYMSPEQAEMAGIDIDTRSDIYSLGVLLYELLVGSTPFDPKELRSKAYGEMQRMIREVEPPCPSTRLSSLLDSLPTVAAHRRLEPRKLGQIIKGELDWIVMRAMEKDRTRRYETANGLAADVQRYLAGEVVLAAKPSAAYRTRKFIRRHRLQFAAVLVVLLSLIGGITASTIGLMRAVRAEGTVRQQKDTVSNERDRAMHAEAYAQLQRQKAESEARRAQVQYANGLVLSGDALSAGRDFLSAYERYNEAGTEFDRLGLPLGRLDLSLVRLYRNSPPPLWSAEFPGGIPKAWIVVPDRKEIVGACADRHYHVLDLVTGSVLRTIEGEAADVIHLTLAKLPGGDRVIATGLNFVRVINPVTGTVEQSASDDRAAAFCAVSPDGKIAVSGDGLTPGKVTFWDTATLKRTKTVESESPCGGVFSHSGELVATDDGGNIQLWDVRTQSKIPSRLFSKSHGSQFRLSQGSDNQFAFTPDDRAVILEWLGELRILPVAGAAATTWTAGDGFVMALLTPPGKDRVVTAGSDGCVRVSNAGISGAYAPFLTLVGDQNPLVRVAYVSEAGPKACPATSDFVGGDQAVVVASTDKGRLFAWPLSTPFSERGVGYPRALSDKALLYAGGVHGTGGMRSGLSSGVSDTATGKLLCVIPSDPNPFNGESAEAISHDGKTLFTEAPDDSLQAIDVARAARMWSFHPHKGAGNVMIAISSDDQLVAAVGDRGAVHILNARSGEVLRTLGGDGSELIALAFDSMPHSPVVDADASPTLQSRHLMTITASESVTVCSEWDLGSSAAPHSTRATSSRPASGFLTTGRQIFRVPTSVGSTTIHLLDAFTFQPAGDLGPFRSPPSSFCNIETGNGPGKWVLASDEKSLIALNKSNPDEQLVMDAGNGGSLSSPDGTLVFLSAKTRMNLAMPRLYREISAHPSPTARAAWYAEFGLWAWTRELLDREHAAGRDVPALLWARSLWMCGDNNAARPAFALAVSRNEISSWYAELCLSVEDKPHFVAAVPEILRLEHTYRVQKETEGPTKRETIEARRELITAYEAAKRMDLVLPLWREMLEAGEANITLLRNTNPGSVELAQALAEHGGDLMELSAAELELLHFDHAEVCRRAEPIWRECMGIRKSKVPDNRLTFNAMSFLGGTLLGQKKYAEAEPLLLAGYAGLKWHASESGATIRLFQAANRLAELCEAQGKTDTAGDWKQKAAALNPGARWHTTAGQMPLISIVPGGPPLDAAEVTRFGNLVNSEVTVQGIVQKVFWTKAHDALIINFAGPGSDHLIAWIAPRFLPDFLAKFGPNLDGRLLNAHVTVSGKLIPYGQTLEVVLERPAQLIIDPARLPAATTPSPTTQEIK